MVEDTYQGKIAVTKGLDRVIMKLLMGDQKISWKSIALDVVLVILASDFDFSSSHFFTGMLSPVQDQGESLYFYDEFMDLIESN